MLAAGVIDRAGKMEPPEFLLVSAAESGTGKNIVITESDVKNLLRAKAAIFAGIRTMLSQIEMDFSVVSDVYIAGGFGNHINITDAIKIGMLPDIGEDKYEYVGNSCLKGAVLGIISREAIAEMSTLAGRMTYIELSVGNRFMDEFMSALFIPHTDFSLFPSLRGL
jgi:uncharacterized 2Fe-2S/4Fe-4S cluster protein (DUF4445 family)